MKIVLHLFLLVSTGLTSIVYAEGGCPPGMIPYSGTDIRSCAPIPNYNTHQQNDPQLSWVKTWGAIATGKGATGYSTGMTSKSDAKKNAIKQCKDSGGEKCKVEIAYHNQCAALVAGDRGHSTASAGTTDIAIQLAMKTCTNDGDTGCEVFYSACTLPLQVQQ